MKSIRKQLLIAMFACWAAPLIAAYAEGSNNTLYGLSSDKQLMLLTIPADGHYPTSVAIRPPLQGVNSPRGLVYANGYFYAGCNGGQIVRFGFEQGDEVVAGDTGYPLVTALARNGNGQVYLAFSQNNDGMAESVGLLNLATMQVSNVTNVIDPFNWSETNVVGLAFDGANQLVASHWRSTGAGVYGMLNLATGDWSPRTSPNNAGYWVANKMFDALAYDSVDDKVYGIEGQSGICKRLYLLTRNANQTNIFLADFSACLTGIAYGPVRSPNLAPMIDLIMQ